MAVAGPRLDRPSAIGDEGRPRAASLTVAALGVVVLLLASAAAAGSLRVVPLVGGAVGFTVAGVALLRRTRFRHLVAGHVLVHLAGTTLLLLLLALTRIPDGLVFAGFTLSLLGIAVTWADVGRVDALEDAVVQAAGSYAGIIGSFVGFVLVGGVVIWCWRVLEVVVAGTAPRLSLVAFLGILGIAGLLTHVASQGIPVLALTARDRRPAVGESLERVRWVLARVSLGAIAAAVLVAVAVPAKSARGEAALGLAGTLLVHLSSPLVLGPLVAFMALVVVAGVLGATTDWVTTRWDEGIPRRLAILTAGTLLGAIVVLSAIAPTGGVSLAGVSMLTLGIAGPIEVLIVVGIGWFLVETGLVPERTLGPTLATGGLVVAAIGLDLNGFAPILVFATAAGALLVWDVSTFGLGITVELGHRPLTRRLELFHAGLSIAVAAGAVLVVGGLEVLRQSVGSGLGAAPAMALAGLGLALLVLPLRT